MENKDIRWIQRFNNFLKALRQLNKFVEKGNDLNDMEKQGMIKSFEYTYELAWNTLKDFCETQGEGGLQGSRDAIQLGFKRGLIKDGKAWMEMLKDRNLTSHSYDEETANEIVANILSKHFYLFMELKNELDKIMNGQGNLFGGEQ